ncbi:MAG: hypothetical protein CFE24_05845 [Flavobacterium sp. BFFFF2]|nr:MAG: hypothetical protein CFE24_05845 [Flavobacterium sp. BFFFF2]
MKKTIYCSIFLVLLSKLALAQDPVFTQYYNVLQFVNPGFAGYNESLNAGLLHRTQWPDMNLRVDSDYGFFNTWIDEMNSGIGVNVLSNREQTNGYNFTQVNLNYAYKVALSDSWIFRPGLEVGYGNKSYGFGNLLLGDQINASTGAISPTSVDPSVLRSKVGFFDMSAGLLFNNETSWFGFSVKHLNKPNISLLENGNAPLDMFMNVTVGHEIQNLEEKIGSQIFPTDTKLLLTANFMKQGAFSRLDVGTILTVNSFYVGPTFSLNPTKNTPGASTLISVNPSFGLLYENFKLGLSYDYNTTPIGKTGGVYELSLTYHIAD